MSTRHRFTQVDVFTERALYGNPVAVVHDADAWPDERMAAFARWTNLSETTFLLAPTDARCDYRVRIFTPGGELPFAGHPTLGSCHAWLEAGGRPKAAGEVMQQCAIGPVRIRLSGDRAAFAAPPVVIDTVDASLLAQVVKALAVPPEAVLAARWLDNGPRWLGLRLDGAARVRSARPDHARLESLAKVGLIGACEAGGDSDFEVRAFADPIGVAEDPVTGSLNASLAQWLIGEGHAPSRYVVSQGRAIGRDGRVHIEAIDGTVWVGGRSVSCVRGELEI